MKKLFSFFFIGAFLLVAACGKYEEGPSLSLRSKKARVANEWAIAYAYKFDDMKDKTTDYINETWEFKKDGDFTERESDIVDKAGTWDFMSDKEEIVISFPTKVKKYKILRLKENEMWLKDHEEELHLVTYQ
jgi:hypothetical protein